MFITMKYFMITLMNLFNVDIWSKFTLFQEEYNRTYSIDEVYDRFIIFKRNVEMINMNNADKSSTFNMTINKFTDLTAEEFKQRFVGKMYRSSDYGCLGFENNQSYGVETFDWRSYDVVNPVRNQGQCGSCWAFATTANAESVWAISTGKLYDLSEQYLVDCATGLEYMNMGCKGGNMDSAFKFMINDRQCDEVEYPYTSGVTETKSKCHSCDELTSFSACYDVMSNNQVDLKAAVLKNPVVIGIEADTYYFQSYSGGILTSPLCGTTIDHAVEIVGFGVENDVKYWTVRNSWGADWGEEGYFRILRTDSTQDAGICGLAMEPSFISV
jgi:KDEL-tailed cysteine endopeptidase